MNIKIQLKIKKSIKNKSLKLLNDKNDYYKK